MFFSRGFLTISVQVCHLIVIIVRLIMKRCPTYVHKTFATLHRELRKRRPSKVTVNIYANNILAFLIFLTGINKRSETVGCVVSATLLHYFLLTTWCWMATYAHLLLKSLVVVRYTHFLSDIASSRQSLAIVAICRSKA